jgi:GntR family transcriptional repressor for pyruvate dehydrogenase complex
MTRLSLKAPERGSREAKSGLSCSRTEAHGLGVFKPVRVGRISEAIAKQIERSIRAGKLRPGQRLPAERILAQSFETSRNPVREALRSLEALGYISVRGGKGTFVVSSDPASGQFEALRSHFTSQRARVEEYFDVHGALFSEAARLAAARPDRDVSFAARALKRQERAVASANRTGILYADREFTKAVAQLSGNTTLLELVLASMDYLKKSRLTLFAFDAVRYGLRSLRQHEGILEAIRAGNRETASGLAREHVMSAKEEWEKLALPGPRGAARGVAGPPGTERCSRVTSMMMSDTLSVPGCEEWDAAADTPPEFSSLDVARIRVTGACHGRDSPARRLPSSSGRERRDLGLGRHASAFLAQRPRTEGGTRYGGARTRSEE